MSDQAQYQVLARTYRPQTFADLIGQDAMVQTLKNAFAADRIAHAFVLTGVRGVGKTTTARIIAKGLNCVGPDGTGGPTTEPCGQCEPCLSIAEGRHVDVLEMDAASRTGVNDVREIIESVHYRAASARYKVYIIDEVHMLSTSAFNALLKTLEEPPAHVKFIFATTEIRKVPVTVLSRCQRFDLRRIEADAMLGHLAHVAGLEGAQIGADALSLIVRAAEGSMRDALSLMDQAIAHGAGETGADQVRAMLGLADRGRVMDLFERIMEGKPAEALAELSAQYSDGADPLAVLRDLAEVTHWISVCKITPDAAQDPTVSPGERDRGLRLAGSLPMRALTRAWQMLVKILEEAARAPNTMMAAEMGVIRLTYAADLPPTGDLVRKLQSQGGGAPAGSTQRGTPAPGSGGQSPSAPRAVAAPRARSSTADGAAPLSAPATSPDLATQALARYARLEDVMELIRTRRDLPLLVEVEKHLRPVAYAPGRIEFEPTPDAPTDLAPRLAARLQAWTGVRWGVSVVAQGGGETFAERRRAEQDDLTAQALAHPLVQAVLASFPQVSDAQIKVAPPPSEDQTSSDPIDDPEDDPDWDPFD
ncbi:MAG: DNA polymerase III subunit gamma/tau [Pseudomonadota bacterium]